MKSILAVLFFFACASAQDFRNVKKVNIAVDIKPKLEPQKGDLSDGPLRTEPQSENSIGGRIINGTEAMPGQFPWQVVTYMDQSYMCGGSIISPEWILTAAHCVQPFSRFVIFMGVTNRNEYQDGQLVRLAIDKIWNENYNSSSITNDIGLLKVIDITYSENIKAIQLPKLSDVGTTYAYDSAIVSGFGYTSESSSSPSNTLEYASVTVITNSECVEIYGGWVTDNNICTNGTDSQASCNGDSGGPLIYLEGSQYIEIGIVSFGVDGCVGAPSVFTRVTNYLEWISNNTGIQLTN